MTIDIREKEFENHIGSTLVAGGYISRTGENFDRKLALDTTLVIQFLKNSQPQSWKELSDIYGSELENEILRQLTDDLGIRGMINVLRGGIQVSHVHLDCAYFKPVSKRNPDAGTQYEKNILSVIRQAIYSENNGRSVDLLLFLNGLPLATGEIKNPVKGQSFRDAIKQYEQDRDPRDKLFEFKKRALVHFAIDPYEVHITTRLNGDKTMFLPFNKGRNEGRGNPDNPNSYRTSYLWEEIWQKDTWLEIISNFIHVQRIEQKDGPPKEDLIFPRYHQLDAVVKLTNATRYPGSSYLIQHSTGSGKSNTIAWLAYKLFSLHDDTDKPIFDSVIVLSDRVGIVNQLGNTIRQFEQVPGTFGLVETTSDLAEKLETERKILISTQQKFPFLSERLTKLKGKYFAIIIDEAHSSQTGEAATKVKAVLSANLEEAARIEAEIEQSEPDLVDMIEKQMRSRGRQANLSYYAFTATPKHKTLRIFGTAVSKEKYEPFHKFSMKQAIDEGFILDVLKNYSTYDGYFRIQIASEDKVVVRKKASRALIKYVDTHHLNLSRKVEEIVEHFRTHCQPRIGGLAKAMVVASSRIQALKYKQEIDSYVLSRNYAGIKTLVAFSGTIQGDDGNNFTEQNINKTSTEWELREKFDSPEYNILVVAEKYQTGYDQPLLHTLYIDRKLRGIKVVQTLSRINRIHAGKTDSFVMDFQNTVEEITKAYEPYYKGTSLVDKIDPAYLLRLYDKIMSFNIITIEDLDRFAEIFFKPRSSQTIADLGKLYALMNPALNRYEDTKETDKDEFKHKLVEYIEAYSFLSQVVSYDDTKFEKMFVFNRFIASKDLLPEIYTQLPQLKGDVSLQYYRLQKTHQGDILVTEEARSLVARDELGKPNVPDVLTTLSDVVQRINEKFEGDVRISDADEITLMTWLESLEKDSDLRQVAKANEFEDFLRKYRTKLQEQMVISLSDNKRLVSLIFSDPDLMNKITISAARYYQRWASSNDLPPIRPGTPAENRLMFRRIIQSCKGFVHWLDLYIGQEGLEFLVDSFDHQNVKDIKLLSSLHNNENQINVELRDRFDQFKKELEGKGISLEMKVISTKSAYDMVAHDRFIIGENAKYNVPSFTTVVKGRFSEIKKTTNDIPFIDYWNDKDSLDIMKDWLKVKNILDKKTRTMYEACCSDCDKKVQVPFKPDGVRPVYCVDCRRGH